MSSVILRNLVKSYDGNKNVIDNINLEIKDKEFIVLVGSSGCGKSTILRLISGLEDISSGEIMIDGKVVNNVHPKDRDIAFVFQSYALYPHMSVYDNIAFGLKMRKYSKAVIDEKVHEVAKALDLADLLSRKPRQLSGGQRQRVALGRAIVRNPKVFLMDEPLSNLDAKLRLHMRTEIRRIQQELKLTCLYVTHDQKEALTMSDRIMVMNKGKIEQIGTPMHLYDDPATPFVADFIGQANLFYGTLVSVEDKYGLVDVAGRRVKARMGVLNPPRIGGKALLIVRPENLNIGTSENCLAVKLINRLFEGDRIDYQFEVVNGINPKPYSMSVPFLPGTSLLPEGSTLDASFVPDAGVLLNGE